MDEMFDGEKSNKSFNECYSLKDHKLGIKTAPNVMHLNPPTDKDHFDVKCGNLSIDITPNNYLDN